MAILAECPICHRKQSTRNKVCSCGADLDKAKRSKRVRYWIQYRLPGGKQRKEAVGYSIDEARDADGKRKVQKRENRIFDMLPEARMTFSELTGWYIELKRVRRLASYDRVVGCLANFNQVFGSRLVSSVKPMDLENYQENRQEKGAAPATIDMELSVAQTMVTKAFDNDMLDGRALKAFRKVKKRLKKGSNARKRTLGMDEYLKLTQGKRVVKGKGKQKDKERIKDIAPAHLRALIEVAFHTGMRRGELLGLQWSHIDRKNGFIRLPAEMTKERKPKSIPVNHHVEKVLSALPRALHHDHVFTFRGKPIDRLGRSLQTACGHAGIPYGQIVPGGFRFHDVRATFDTNMDRAGVSETCRKAIMGHSLQGMDRHYLRLDDEDLKAAMDQYTAWFDAQFANVTQNVTQEAK
jgi:integrase